MFAAELTGRNPGFSFAEDTDDLFVGKTLLVGSLHAGTGRVDYASGTSKSSELFIKMLRKLRSAYHCAKTITLIVDNYIIHKSKNTLRWLKRKTKFIVIYQLVCSVWVSKIELLCFRFFQPSVGTLPVSGYSGVHEVVPCYIPVSQRCLHQVF
ncbi:IS630 orf [Pectobacterium atrosepticum ICMP 1526]|nr:IS630 orf [Pectobacterium atrosepticum ICMP 1526]